MGCQRGHGMDHESICKGTGYREEMILLGWTLTRCSPTLTQVILVLGSFSSMMQSKITVVSILVSMSSRGFRIRMF